MKQVMNTSVKRKSDQQRIAVLRLELDYELAVLYEAIQENDNELKQKTIVKLEKIRRELLKLDVL